MALIICKECGKEYSNHAPACPNCGYPTEDHVVATNSLLAEADMAFGDCHYEEAYDAYLKSMANQPNNPHIQIRLALSNFARNLNETKLPPASMKMLSDGIASLGKDSAGKGKVKKYIDDVNVISRKVRELADSEVGKMEQNLVHERSAGSQLADAFVYSPLTGSQTRAAQDSANAAHNRSVRSNITTFSANIDTKISDIKETFLEALSGVFNSDNPIPDECVTAIKEMATTAKAKVFYNRIVGTVTQENSWGKCFGEEKVLLVAETVTAWLKKNGASVWGTVWSAPKGKFILTNYKLKYLATKEKFSFEISLEHLLRITPSATYTTFYFNDNISVECDLLYRRAVTPEKLKEIIDNLTSR